MKKKLTLSLTTLFLTGILLLMNGYQANAQSYVEDDSVVVSPVIYGTIGGYFPYLTTSLRIDSDLGLGTDISLEDDFKMPVQLSVFKADITWRIKKRSQFVFSFTSMQRDKNLVIDRDITFADTTFHIDSEIDVFFNTNYYGYTWRYSVWDKPGWNAGFSLGLRVLQVNAGISARLNNEEYSRSKEIFAPAMLFGIHGSGYLTDRLLARFSMEYFQLSVEELRIVVLENKFSLEYYIIKNAGIGAGYATSIYNVKDIPFSEDFKGRIRYGFGGFQAYLTARF